MSNGAGSDIVADFRTGFETVRRHPVIVAPPLIAMAVGFVLKLVFIGAGAGMFIFGGVFGGPAGAAGALLGGVLLFFVFIVLVLLINLVASAAVIIMARDALAAREPSVGGALDVVMARLTDVVIASFLFSVIVGIASLFFVLPGLIAGFFLMFALPAVLLDGVGAVDGVRRSATLVKENLGPVIGLVVGAIVGIVLLMIASAILGVVPLLGTLAAMLLMGAFFAYLTVVVVRVYQSLPRR
jgi:hypothetical protein